MVTRHNTRLICSTKGWYFGRTPKTSDWWKILTYIHSSHLPPADWFALSILPVTFVTITRGSMLSSLRWMETFVMNEQGEEETSSRAWIGGCKNTHTCHGRDYHSSSRTRPLSNLESAGLIDLHCSTEDGLPGLTTLCLHQR